MTTVLFVHGIGVRRPDYEASFQLISNELLTRRPDLRLAPCLWGEELGSRLHAGGASIPLYDTTRGLDAVGAEDEETALWGLLYQDPLYELRLLSLRTDRAADIPSGADFVFGSISPGDMLDEQVRSLSVSPTLQAKLDALGIAEVFHEALLTIVDSTPYQEALQAAPEAPGPYRAAIARAVVAQAIVLRQQRPAARLWDAALRDEIVILLIIALGDTDRSILGPLGTLVLANPLTLYLRRWRGRSTDALFPLPGDTLLYQARGEPIRQFIHEQVKQVAPPMVLLAHSLGGVACVDLLIQQPSVRQQVQLLITVGSQAPFFYEIGALYSLAPGEALPPDFPSWLNLYDLNDFLSYIGATVFPNRVQDVLVDNRQPFPQAHGAYWTNPATWNAILARLP